MGNSNSGDRVDFQLDRVDEAYETKMVAFESDCNDGKGDPTACHHVGEFFSAVKEDYARASKVYESNCRDKGYPASCFNLGRLHMAGRGAELDDAKAEALFDKACDGGHLRACYLKGVYLYTAVELAQKRAEEAQSSASVASNTADAASVKPGKVANSTASRVPDSIFSGPSWQDYYNKQNALKKFDFACRGGDVDSCYLYASHYLEESKIITYEIERKERNPAKAVEYLTLACDRNHAPSCFNLAVMYSKGDTGVPADAEKSAQYKHLTNDLIRRYGGLEGHRTA